MAKEWKSCKKESKTDWGQIVEGEIGRDQIQLGAILRIADATEKMASSYDDLRKERDYLNDRIEIFKKNIHFDEKRIAGLKGYIGRLRKIYHVKG